MAPKTSTHEHSPPLPFGAQGFHRAHRYARSTPHTSSCVDQKPGPRQLERPFSTHFDARAALYARRLVDTRTLLADQAKVGDLWLRTGVGAATDRDLEPVMLQEGALHTSPDGVRSTACVQHLGDGGRRLCHVEQGARATSGPATLPDDTRGDRCIRRRLKHLPGPPVSTLTCAAPTDADTTTGFHYLQSINADYRGCQPPGWTSEGC